MKVVCIEYVCIAARTRSGLQVVRITSSDFEQVSINLNQTPSCGVTVDGGKVDPCKGGGGRLLAVGAR
jgi:hypothetical protein